MRSYTQTANNYLSLKIDKSIIRELELNIHNWIATESLNTRNSSFW